MRALIPLTLGLCLLFSFQLQGKSLKILSYNINGLPSPLKRNKPKLFQYIKNNILQQIEEGDEPDIILLQEAFTKSSRKHLINNLNHYPYIIRGNKAKTPSLEQVETCRKRGKSNCSSGKILDSGIYILSKFPILEWDRVMFGKHCAGFDCFSNKAVFYFKVFIPWVGEIDLFTTHMNASGKMAGSKKKNLKAKIGQIAKVKTIYVRNRNKDLPMIFAGDVNLHPNKVLYDEFKEAIEAVNVGEECLKSESCVVHQDTQEEEIFEWTNDQHFSQDGTELSVVPVYLERGYRDPVLEDKKQRLPSDHYSYEVHYDFQIKSD